MKLNILHFSDLHYIHDDAKIINLRDKILDCVDKNEMITLMIFSGDLVYKPSADNFNNSYEHFIKLILNKYNISIDNCFFTIGNHDVDLNKRSKLIFSGLKAEKEDKKTIQEVLDNEIQLNEFKDYNNFINNLNQKTLKENNVFFQIYKTNFEHIKIGCVSFNTSLFMEDSKTDFGKLWININLLNESVKNLNDCDIKILNLHHPLDWFSNKNEIENFILDKFNLVFFGHEHNHSGKYILDVYNKDILSLHATSLHHPKNERNGFCIYNYQIDTNELVFKRKDFNKQHNIFETIKSETIENVNLMKKVSKAIRNQHICSEIYPNLKKHINKYLAINLTSENIKKDIEEIYIHPKIIEENLNKRKNDFNLRKKEIEKDSEFSLKDIINLEKNTIFYAKKESGKTTLLNMINITYLITNNNYIPIFISGNELVDCNSISMFTAKIEDYFNKFYHNKNLPIKKMIQEKRFIFLIDDINNLSYKLISDIINLDNIVISTFSIKEYEVSDEKILSLNNENDLFHNFKKLEIKALRKKDNKLLTKQIVPEESYKRISTKVLDSLSNLNLPSNPFITTLLAWMYVEKIDIRENEPQIIDVFLDYLLEKSDLSKTFEGKLNFSDKKDLLSKIAFKFFIEQKLALREDEILNVIIEHSKQFYAFTICSKDILEYFYKRRILINNFGLVQFSYRVFYYYFISLYMITNKEFYQLILNNKLYLINMIDELKYYAALQRYDTETIEKIESYFHNNFNKKLQKIEFPEIKLNVIIENISNQENDNTITENKNPNSESFLSENDKELTFRIDDIKTEIRENSVENFNKNTLIKIEDKKSLKEEFFILNMIYSEFIKHLVSVKVEEKEIYFKKAIDNYIRIFNYWEQMFERDVFLKRLIKIKFPNEAIEDKGFNFIKINFRNEILTMLTQIVDITLSTPKMLNMYNTLYSDKNPYNIFLSLILKSETENYSNELINQFKSFLNINTNINFDNIIKIKLFYDITSKTLTSDVQKNIKNLLIDLEYKLNGAFIQKNNISKKEIQNFLEENIKMSKLLS